MNVLIIADDPYVRATVKAAVCRFRAACTIFEACSPQEALNIMQSTSIDMAFSEIDMLKMNGLAFIEAYRQPFLDIHWIVISAFKNFYDIQKAIRLGVRDYLLKPVDEKILYGSIQNAQAQFTGLKRCGTCG